MVHGSISTVSCSKIRNLVDCAGLPDWPMKSPQLEPNAALKNHQVHMEGHNIRQELPSGKRLHNCGKSPFLMGKSTISMAIFNSYVKLPEGTS